MGHQQKKKKGQERKSNRAGKRTRQEIKKKDFF